MARRVLEERPKGGPAFLAYVESVLATLQAGGFSIELAHHTLHVLGSRIFGFNQDVFEDSGPEPSPEEAAMLVRALAAYPHVTELAMSVSHEGVLGKCDDDVEFAFGLDLVLDGLERMRGWRTNSVVGSSSAARPPRGATDDASKVPSGR